MKELDVVKLKKETAGSMGDEHVRIPKGTVGTIVLDYMEGVFEVEFSGKYHGILATVKEESLEEYEKA